MVEETFDVTIRDASGTIVFEDQVESQANGFFGIWLPRDIDGSVDINHDGKSVQGDISTFTDSDTCYTDFQLK